MASDSAGARDGDRLAAYTGYRDAPAGRYAERIPKGSPRNSWLRPSVLWRSRNDRVAASIGDPVNDMRRAWVERRRAKAGQPENWVVDRSDLGDFSPDCSTNGELLPAPVDTRPRSAHRARLTGRAAVAELGGSSSARRTVGRLPCADRLWTTAMVTRLNVRAWAWAWRCRTAAVCRTSELCPDGEELRRPLR